MEKLHVSTKKIKANGSMEKKKFKDCRKTKESQTKKTS